MSATIPPPTPHSSQESDLARGPVAPGGVRVASTPGRSTTSPPRADTRDATIPLAVMALLGAIVAIAIAFTAAQSDGTTPIAPAEKAAATVTAEPTAAPRAATAENWGVEATRFDPATRPVTAGPKTFELTTKEQRVKVGDKVYDLWTFNDTVPGPVLRAVEGDMITVKVHNASSSKMLHSVDFHASRLTMGGGHVQVAPGKTGTFRFRAEHPGVFMYHCATPPVLEHIGRGMYGMIIVQPKEGFGKPMPEYAIVQSELYPDLPSMQANEPSEMAFNGIPNQYATDPIKTKPDSDVRLFFLNAGPSQVSSFHVVGTVFDRVLEDGNPENLTVGRQVLPVAASGGAVFEFGLVGEGKFPLVTHQFNHVAQGAVGMMISGDGEPGAAAAGTDTAAH